MATPVNPRWGKSSCRASFGGARSLACCWASLALAQAQGTYPDRPIRFVVAFPPGGATDTFFRLISNELGTALGQADRDREQGRRRRLHRLADGRSLAGRRLHRAGGGECDRHQPGLFKKHPSGFNPLKDYDAVGAMGSVPLVWTVANNVPANSFPEFVHVVEDRAGTFQLRPRRPRQRVAPHPRGHSRRRRHAGRSGAVQGRRTGGAGGGRRLRRRGGFLLGRRQAAGRRQARQRPRGDERQALAGAAGRADAEGARRQGR